MSEYPPGSKSDKKKQPTAMELALQKGQQEKRRKVAKKKSPNINVATYAKKRVAESGVDIPLEPEASEALIQVETKLGAAWTEPEPEIKLGRAKKPQVHFDEGSLIQVETKKIPSALELEVEEQGQIDERIAAARSVEEDGHPSDEYVIGAVEPAEEITTLPPLEFTLPVSAPMPSLELDLSDEQAMQAKVDGAIQESHAWSSPEAKAIYEQSADAKRAEASREAADLLNVESDAAVFRSNRTPDIVGKSEVAAEKGKLRGLINQLTGNAEGKAGVTERMFRSMGEKYNTLGWKSKLAIGAGLGVGAVLSGGTTAPLVACLGLLAGQRVAGLSSMFLKFEKSTQDGKWQKEKAFLKAGVYTVLMGATIKEAIEFASDTEIAHAAQAKIQNWLGGMLGHHPAAPGNNLGAKTHQVPGADSASADTVAAETAKPEMPSIEASKGHGYEYMMKRLWEDPKFKVLDPNKFEAGSDVYKLLKADPSTIDQLVHKLAAENNFYNEGAGTSAIINMGDKMTISAGGNIQLGNHIFPSDGTHVTLAYHPEVHAAPHAPGAATPPGWTKGPDGLFHGTPPPGTQGPPPPGSPIDSNHQYPPAPIRDSVAAIPGHHEASPAPEAPATPIQEVVPNKPMPQGPDVTSVPAGTPDVKNADLIPGQAGILTNQFGVTIPNAEAHIYQGEKGLIVFGGTPQGQTTLIQEYLTQNPNEVIFAGDSNGQYRVAFTMVNGEMLPKPIRTNGLFGLFSSFMKAPDPSELQKLLK